MMTRTNIYLTGAQLKKFKAIAEKDGYPVAEIIRRALDEWLETHKRKQKRTTSHLTDLDTKDLLEQLRELRKQKQEASKHGRIEPESQRR